MKLSKPDTARRLISIARQHANIPELQSSIQSLMADMFNLNETHKVIVAREVRADHTGKTPAEVTWNWIYKALYDIQG